MINAQRRTGWMDTVDRFIVLTEFARQKFMESGFPAERIAIKPNFVTDPKVYNPHAMRSGALYVGRLSEEKGLRTLLEAWREVDVPLRIAGSGPIEEELRTAAGANVDFLGRISSEQVYEEMARASVLVMPSIWYECFPVTLVEAFACGLPILASNLGSMVEIVEEGVTGNLFKPNDRDDLIRVVRSALKSPGRLAAMSCNARRTYELTYTAEQNAKQLTGIYRVAIEAERLARVDNQNVSLTPTQPSNKTFWKRARA